MKRPDRTIETPQARMAACRALAGGLGRAGQALNTGGYIFRDDAMRGLDVVIEMGAELAAGAVQLLDQELWYAGGSLLRQLIEVEYLTWRFAEDRAAAATWLASTPSEIRKQFSPEAMRRASAGRFRDVEYWQHCDIGGNPAPKGRLLLKDHGSPARFPALALGRPGRPPGAAMGPPAGGPGRWQRRRPG